MSDASLDPSSPEFGRTCAARRPVTASVRPDPDPKITVSIPVRLGGYTGQREQWESRTKEHSVKIESDEDTGEAILRLTETASRSTVEIPWETLKRAVALVNTAPSPGLITRGEMT